MANFLTKVFTFLSFDLFEAKKGIVMGVLTLQEAQEMPDNSVFFYDGAIHQKLNGQISPVGVAGAVQVVGNTASISKNLNNELQLRNDVEQPGPFKAYSTDLTGVPAWRDIATSALPDDFEGDTQASGSNTNNFIAGNSTVILPGFEGFRIRVNRSAVPQSANRGEFTWNSNTATLTVSPAPQLEEHWQVQPY